VGIIIGFIIVLLSLPAHLTAGAVDDHLKVIRSDTEGLILEVLVPEPEVEQVLEKGKLFHRVTISGLAATTDVGRPELPLKGLLIGVPGAGNPEIEVLESDYATFPGYNIYPVPRPVVMDEDDGDKRLTYEFAMDKEVYDTDAFAPSHIAEIGFTGLMREQRVVQLKLFPLQFNPVTGGLRFHHRIMVRVNFNSQCQAEQERLVSTVGGERKRELEHLTGGAYERLLIDLLLNYGEIRTHAE
jgi:hypothetical protein